MPESKLYPMLYKQYPEIEFLNRLSEVGWDLEQTIPDIEELQELGLGSSDPQKRPLESGILDQLVNMVRQSEEDYKRVMHPEWTDDIVLNKVIKDDRKDYFKNRIKTQSTDICDFIDGLIQLDKYPKKMFGMYKKLHHLVKSSHDPYEQMRALNQLRIIAVSVVPPHIKFQQMQVIEQALVSNTRVTEG